MNFLRNTWAAIKAAFSSIIDVVVVLLTALMLGGAIVFSSGVLHTGAVIGAAVLVSVLFVMASAKAEWRMPIISFFAKTGFWIDLTITVVLTVVGFMLGATMAASLLFVAFCFSTMLALCRMIYRAANAKGELNHGQSRLRLFGGRAGAVA